MLEKRGLWAAGVFGIAAVAGCGSSNAGPVGMGPLDGGSTSDSARESAAPADAGSAPGEDGSAEAVPSDGSQVEASADARRVEATTYFVSVLRLMNGLCLPQVLPPDGAGLVPCEVFYELAAGDSCAAHAGLSEADPAMFAYLTNGIQVPPTPQSVCVLAQLPTSDWVNGSCVAASQAGWCYVAGAAASPCAQTLDVSPAAEPPMGALVSLGCSIPSPTGSFSGASDATPVGVACTPSSERSASFGGFDYHTVALDEGNSSCGNDVCLVNHFQGRTTCPYGQDANGNGPAGQPACTVPGTNTPVHPAGQTPIDAGGFGDFVSGQCTLRRPSRSVYCSCRCANAEGKTDDGAAYCACPNGFSCAQLIPSVQPGDPRAGAYCIANGTAYEATQGCSTCDPTTASCP